MKSSSRGPYLVLTALGACGGGYIYIGRPSKSTSSLNTGTFTPFTILSREPISSTSTLFTISQPEPTSTSILAAKFDRNALWSVEFKQPQLQIARSYTPLPPRHDGQDTSTFRFLIRRDQKGEVSNYLHRLPEHGTIHVRGPYDDYTVPDTTRRIIFLAGGTGIAPALQVAHSLRDTADTTILWANRRREDCTGGHHASNISWLEEWKQWLGSRTTTREHSQSRTVNPIVRQLESLRVRSNGRLAVEYHVDEEHTQITPARVQQLAKGSPGDAPDSKVILVSGPEGFVNYWAGPKAWANGCEVQGPLGGQLARMKLDGWKVIKL